MWTTLLHACIQPLGLFDILDLHRELVCGINLLEIALIIMQPLAWPIKFTIVGSIVRDVNLQCERRNSQYS